MPENSRTTEPPVDLAARSRPRVLIFADSYLPGRKAGGPTRSISGIIDRLNDEFDFLVLTRDRDMRDPAPYRGVEKDSWTRAYGTTIYYASPGNQTARNLWNIVCNASPDLVFLNSVFSRLSIRFLLRRRLRGSCIPTLIAARGELSPGALHLKAYRKRAYLAFALAVRLFHEVRWQASSDIEKKHIAAALGLSAQVDVAVNIPAVSVGTPSRPQPKEPGTVALAYISSVLPKKNLLYLIDVLSEVSGDITLSVFGPKDSDYWREVQAAVESLPSNVRVIDGGVLDYEGVRRELDACHFFVLPTLDENFGHAIIEALSVGRPIVISDRTPWSAVSDYCAGWVIPLEDEAGWLAALQETVESDDTAYQALASNAYRFFAEWAAMDETHVGQQRSALTRTLESNKNNDT